MEINQDDAHRLRGIAHQFLNKKNTVMFEDFKKYEFPKWGWIRIPELFPTEKEKQELDFKGDFSPMGYLKAVTRKGFTDKLNNGKIPKEKKKEYSDRIKSEFEVLDSLGFSSYILLVYKILNFCHESNILTSPARGSSAGSLVNYCVGITNVDPIRYNLLFERFLSADRAEVKEMDGKTYMESSSLPDVDIDVDPERREDVIKYIETVFPNKTCQISTLSKFTGKILIKDILKTLNTFNEEEAKRVSGMLEVEYGKVEKIEDALKNNKLFAEFAKDHKREMGCAILLQDLTRQKSVHAAAVFLSENDVEKSIPLELSSQKTVITGYEMEDAQQMGIKLDILGLQTLTIIKHCLRLTGIKMDDIDVDDPVIYEFLKESDKYYGLFQISEGLGADTVSKVKPDNFEEIVNCLSLGRPASMAYISDYVKIKNGEKEVEIEPRLKEILGPTYGILLFQEGFMALSRKMASFSGRESDGLRRGISKKKHDVIESFKGKFFEGSLKNDYSQEFIDKTWESIEAAGNYGFCKSHAVSYGMVTAITTYLKAKYTPQFFAALLLNAIAHKSDKQEVVEKISQEMNHFGIRFLPPSLLKSELEFSIKGRDIRYGLSAIKGVSDKSFENLLSFRKEYSNKIEMFEAAKQAGLNVGVLSALIYSGCLDEMNDGRSRCRLALEAQLYNLLTQREKVEAINFTQKYNHDIIALVRGLYETEKTEKGKPVIPEKRRETIKKKFRPYHEIFLHNKKHEQLANYIFEKHFLGFIFSVQLKEVFESDGDPFISVSEVNKRPENEFCTLVATVNEIEKGIASNKKKTRWLRLVVADESGSVNVMIFNDAIDAIKEKTGRLPKEDDLVFVKGSKKGDAIFAQKITIQDKKVFLKIADLK